MTQHNLLTYLRLKLIVTLLRGLVRIQTFLSFRRDRTATQDIKRSRIRIPSRDHNRSITLDLYHPSNPFAPPTVPQPILINWHGSGFVLPLHGSDTIFCAHIARTTGLPVLDADYRKAPESPFPAAVEDVEDVFHWISSQPNRFDSKRIALSGFSAGGNLALVAASVLSKKITSLTIRAVIAFYPPTNLSIAPEAKKAPRPKKPIPPVMANLFNECYVPDKAVRMDTRVSPSLADLADFPSTVAILTCDGDSLAPEANALAEKLRGGERKVVHRMLAGAHHGFDKGVGKGSVEWDRREEAYTLAVETLKEALDL